MLRRLLVVAALAGAALPVAASAGGPQPPFSCHTNWVEVARTTPNLPYLVIYRPETVCYG